MLIRRLCAYRVTKCVGKISLRNSKQLLEKLQIVLGRIFLPDQVDTALFVNIRGINKLKNRL